MPVICSRQIVVPVLGKLLSDYAVGDTVFLMENGAEVEYLIVHQGLPHATIYDPSCDGTWLLRKDCYKYDEWNTSGINSYEDSTIYTYLNNDFLNLFDAKVKSAVETVKIPYRSGSGASKIVFNGERQNVNERGLSTKVFLLSSAEVGFNTGYEPTNEGVELSYFLNSSDKQSDDKRVAKLDGDAVWWWLRSPLCGSGSGSTNALTVNTSGSWDNYECSRSSIAVRPALVLNSDTMFDPDTNVIK